MSNIGHRPPTDNLAAKVVANAARQQRERTHDDVEAGGQPRRRRTRAPRSRTDETIPEHPNDGHTASARRALFEHLRAASSEQFWDEVIDWWCGDDPSPDNVVATFSLRRHNTKDRRWCKAWNKAHREYEQEIWQQAQREAASVADQIIPNKHEWPPQWTQRGSMGDNLARQGNQHLLSIYRLLWEDRWRPETAYAEAIARRFTIHEEGGCRYVPVLATVPFEKIKRELGIGSKLIQRYIGALVVWGLIEDTGRYHGERGPKIYRLGWWQYSPRRVYPRPIADLKETPQVRQALRSVRVSQPGYGRNAQ